MTLPHERTRAIVQTRQFLEDLERDASQSVEVRCTANQLLRHFPCRCEVLLRGQSKSFSLTNMATTLSLVRAPNDI